MSMYIELNAYALALKNACTAIEDGDTEEALKLVTMVIDDVEDALDDMEVDEVTKINALLAEALPGIEAVYSPNF